MVTTDTGVDVVKLKKTELPPRIKLTPTKTLKNHTLAASDGTVEVTGVDVDLSRKLNRNKMSMLKLPMIRTPTSGMVVVIMVIPIVTVDTDIEVVIIGNFVRVDETEQ
jgi:hypothetical protein